MPEFVSIEKEEYYRIRNKKPLSFLAKKEQKLLELAKELLKNSHRKSHQDRKSLGVTRFSVKNTFKSL